MLRFSVHFKIMFFVDIVLLILVVIVSDQMGKSQCHTASPDCDSNNYAGLKEGNNGVTSDIPWLGLLRVHIPQDDMPILALTGLVLVKQTYAIANADDVARIPRNIFRDNSKAMFIPKTGEAWFCGVWDYMTHPEFENSTLNTIALVELHLAMRSDYPLKPICLPTSSFNSDLKLYAFEFVDDNQILEKNVHSIKNVETSECRDHYEKVGLAEEKLTPVHYQCGYAWKSNQTCVWDNGMTLASNSSKRWTLIGFGIRGPGCRATARFITLFPYLQWIHFNTNPDNDGTRRSALHEGFRKQLREEIVPLAPPVMDEKYQQEYYEFDTEQAQGAFSVDRIADNAIDITKFAIPGKHGDCGPKNDLIFADSTKVIHKGHGGSHSSGSVSYRLSLYDLHFLNYTCVRVELVSIDQSPATIYWSASIDNAEGSFISGFGEMPEHMIREYPMPSLKFDSTTSTDNKYDPDKFTIQYLKDPNPTIKMQNWNIYFKLEFEGQGVLRVKIYGPTESIQQRRTTTPKPTTTYIPLRRGGDNTNNNAVTQKPYNKRTKDVNRKYNKSGQTSRRPKISKLKFEHLLDKPMNISVGLNSTARRNSVRFVSYIIYISVIWCLLC